MNSMDEISFLHLKKVMLNMMEVFVNK